MRKLGGLDRPPSCRVSLSMLRLFALLAFATTTLIAGPSDASPPIQDWQLLKPGTRPMPRQRFAQPPPPRFNQNCLKQRGWGRVIYLEQTRSTFRRRPRPRPRGFAPRRVPLRRGVTIYSNGAWRRYGYGRTRQGCLNQVALHQLRRTIRRAKFSRDPRPHAVCKALPRWVTTVGSGRRSYTFRHPCAARIHPTLSRLRNYTRAITTR